MNNIRLNEYYYLLFEYITENKMVVNHLQPQKAFLGKKMFFLCRKKSLICYNSVFVFFFQENSAFVFLYFNLKLRQSEKFPPVYTNTTIETPVVFNVWLTAEEKKPKKNGEKV